MALVGRGLCLPPGDIDHWGRAQPGKVLDAEERRGAVGGPARPPFVCRHGLGRRGPAALTAALLLQNTSCLALDLPSRDLESKQSQTSHGF